MREPSQTTIIAEGSVCRQCPWLGLRLFGKLQCSMQHPALQWCPAASAVSVLPLPDTVSFPSYIQLPKVLTHRKKMTF